MTVIPPRVGEVHLWDLRIAGRDARRAAVRGMVARYLGAPPSNVPFVPGEHGKPRLAGSDLELSWSDSGDRLVFGVARDVPIGVDLERIREGFDFAAIAERHFTPAEVGALGQLSRAPRRHAAYELWVQKEAYLKGLGVGLTGADGVIATPLDPAYRVAHGLPSGGGWESWGVALLEVDEGYVAALAAKRRLRTRWFRPAVHPVGVS